MDQAAIARLRIPATSAWARDATEAAPALSDRRAEPDEALLELAGQGSKEALSALFRRHARQVWSIGHRILRDSAEAEDLVQDVFLYVYRRSALYDSAKGSALSWLIQVAHTQAFQRRRKLKSHGLYELPNGESPGRPEAAEENGSDYDQSVEGLFGWNGWRKMLESLSEEQRETLRLHFFEGYTFQEIAEKLGQSYTNVRHHHYRGLERLRKSLAENGLNRR